MKLRNLLLITLILLFMALPALAQDSTPPELAPVAAILPPVLVGLIAVNNRLTDQVKRYLATPELPFTPSEQLRGFIVLASSAIIGIVSAYITPHATDWLGAEFAPYPLAAVVLTGLCVSLGASAVEMVLSLLNSLKRPNAPNSATWTSVAFSPKQDQ